VREGFVGFIPGIERRWYYGLMGKEVMPHIGEEEYSLAQFQADMAEWAAKEARSDEQSGHFLTPGTRTREINPAFDPSCLTGEDMDLWKRMQERTITLEEFRQYQADIEALDRANPATESRVIFSAFAGNKAMSLFFRQ